MIKFCIIDISILLVMNKQNIIILNLCIIHITYKCMIHIILRYIKCNDKSYSIIFICYYLCLMLILILYKQLKILFTYKLSDDIILCILQISESIFMILLVLYKLTKHCIILYIDKYLNNIYFLFYDNSYYIECVICYEYSNNNIKCQKCKQIICNCCYVKLKYTKCPYCRNNYNTINILE